MMLKQKILLIIFAGIFASSVVGTFMSSASKSEFTIKMAGLSSQEDEDYDGLLVFKDYVESRSNGRIAVKLFPSGQFCDKERECLEGLQSGVLEAYMTTVGGFGNVFGPVQAFDLPYVFDDDAVAECVFDGPVTDDLRQAILDSGLNMRLMVVSNTGGWRHIATADKQIRQPSDLEGLKIRTVPAAIQQELVRQLGANPTPMAWSEIYTSLATGVVEGTKNGIQDIVSAKLHEHIKYLTLDGHAYMAALWWFSESFWQKLPDELKRIVFDGFHHLKIVTRALPIRRQIESYEEFKKAGGTIYVPTPEQKALFRQATSGMRDWYIDQYGTDWLEKLDNAVAACKDNVDKRYQAVNRS